MTQLLTLDVGRRGMAWDNRGREGPDQDEDRHTRS